MVLCNWPLIDILWFCVSRQAVLYGSGASSQMKVDREMAGCVRHLGLAQKAQNAGSMYIRRDTCLYGSGGWWR